ncbi:hypothetical protein A8709_10390 [Paenibacillus pectinilyticus]|uniref:Uncharacterized protein n=1 Tax=Paenibacillus pectinilyticus TaxID=512399 RepID=A0A1C1A650_9BACL|nr:hypothetical protein A8709_10390 [Paenibacillus pectinilyticus]
MWSRIELISTFHGLEPGHIPISEVISKLTVLNVREIHSKWSLRGTDAIKITARKNLQYHAYEAGLEGFFACLQ